MGDNKKTPLPSEKSIYIQRERAFASVLSFSFSLMVRQQPYTCRTVQKLCPRITTNYRTKYNKTWNLNRALIRETVGDGSASFVHFYNKIKDRLEPSGIWKGAHLNAKHHIPSAVSSLKDRSGKWEQRCDNIVVAVSLDDDSRFPWFLTQRIKFSIRACGFAHKERTKSNCAWSSTVLVIDREQS